MLCGTKGCNASAKLEYVEASMLCSLEDILAKIEFELPKRSAVDVEPMKKALEQIKKSLSKAQAQKDHLYELLEQQVYSVEVFRQRSITIDTRIDELKSKETQQADAIVRASREREIRLVKRIRNVLEAYGTAESAREKNQLLKSIVDQAIYEKAKGSEPKDLTLTLQLKDY